MYFNSKYPDIVISEEQKDYDLYHDVGGEVFIYGYPYCDSKWVKAKDIYGEYLISNKFNSFINKLEGVYSIIILDRKLNKCCVITDRYGIYTLFYYKTKQFIVISDKIKTILKFMDEVHVDRKSILEYLTFGYMNRIGSKTHIEGINEFRGANIYTIKDGSIEFVNYWKIIGKSPEAFPEDNKKAFLKEFNKHILNGFNLEQNKVVTFTGGLDTRTILSSVIDDAEDLHCYTYGVKKSGDIRIADKITNQFGIKHDSVILDKAFIKNIPEYIKNNINMLNGLSPMAFQLHWIEFCERNKDKGELLTLGISGDEVWRCHHANADKIKNCLNMDDIANFILTEYMIQKNKTLNVFKGLDEDTIKEILKISIKEELVNYSGSFNPIAVTDFFNLKYHYANWVSNLVKFYGRYFKIFLGLVNKNLLAYLTNIDLDDRVSGTLQKYMIESNYPKLADIPYCHDRFNETKTIKMKLKKIIYKIKFLANRISHRFLNFNIFKYFPDLPHYYWIWIPKYHKQFVLDVFDYDNMILRNLFNKDELQKIIKLFLKSDYSVKAFVMSLMSLELWLKDISKNHKVIM